MRTTISRFLYLTLFLVGIGAPFTALTAQDIHTCTVIPGARPTAPAAQPKLPPGARAAVSYNPRTRTYDKSWANGSTVTIRFLGGSAALRQRVLNYAREWTRYANLNFQVVNSGRADIRVGFTRNGSSWSLIGNDANRVDQSRPSMNFGWLTDQTPDYEVKRTVLHEFGHALGLLHEHQNPAGGIPWNAAAVYDHYRRTQGWDQRTTYHNVMATADHSTTQYSSYDRASIMHYPVDARLTDGRYVVGMNNELSPTDRQFIARMYPGRRPATATNPTGRPPLVTTTTTTSPSRPAPTRTRPTTTTTSTRTRPVPAPRRKTYSVGIANQLGQNQQAETVHLNVAGRKYVIRLDRNGRSSEQVNLSLPAGRYSYQVQTQSTFFGYRNVRRREGVRREYVEQTIPGSGRGVLVVDGNTRLSLYGDMDRNTGQLKVYLGRQVSR